MKAPLALAGLMVVSAAFGQSSDQSDNPGSLWTSASGNAISDRVAHHVGDIVTVLVVESSTSSFTAQTTTNKADSASIAKGIGPVLANLIPNLGVGASSSTTGGGTTNQAGVFTVTLTATIKSVLPNGNLVIEGSKDLVTNRDTQSFSIKGVIRPQDISPTDTVLSTKIADAQIKATGKGQISERQRKGLLIRLLDWLF